MVLLGTRFVSRRFIGVQLVSAVIVIATLQATVDLYGHALNYLGKDPTLTDRTEVWSDLMEIDINPVLGAGFESFWLGWRREYMWERWWWRPNQSHNGYIETYVNLGWVGVFFLGGAIFATYRKGRSALLRDVNEGRLRLAFLLAIVLYNYTEAAFKGVHLMWTMFHLVAIDYPLIRAAQAQKAADRSRWASASPPAVSGDVPARVRLRTRPGHNHRRRELPFAG
jgi:O-antigen ligase